MACKLFGEHEAMFFSKLPSNNEKTRKMEQMFENDDLKKICNTLNLPNNSSYEKIILDLYYNKNKKKIIENVSDATKRNFSSLSTMIKKGFEKYEDE